jgi:hypothetical protein
MEKDRKERLKEMIEISINNEGADNFSIVIQDDNRKIKQVIEGDLSEAKIPWKGIYMQLHKHIAEDLAKAISEIIEKIDKDRKVTIDIHPLRKERWNTTFQISIFSETILKRIESNQPEEIEVWGDMAKATFSREVAKKFAEALLKQLK